MDAIAALTPDQARKLWHDYLSRQQLHPHFTNNYPQRRPVFNSYRHRPAVIGSALASPASSLVAATSCTVYFLELQTDGSQVLNVTPYEAYNDDPEIEGIE